ncbi:hypothetical protein, partial [Klebsiella quasipneumoniae]|uniref:hypothetical protein n=1 Tax=Klebsiella quasipneumoniae TaxID=1463165 RepID=UPI0027320015
KPQALETAVENIASRSASADQIPRIKAQLSQEAMRLMDHRFLLDHEQQKQPMQMELGSFDAAESHVRMLNDHTRTLAFREALQDC